MCGAIVLHISVLSIDSTMMYDPRRACARAYEMCVVSLYVNVFACVSVPEYRAGSSALHRVTDAREFAASSL